MLYRYINQFLGYCRLADLSARSIQALTIRSNEFINYLKTQRIRSVKKITYQHLVDFVADYKNPSIHVRKSRVWVLRYSFATEMYHQNVPLSAIQAMMGHDSIADTSIYIHVSDKLKQLALDSILISRRFSWQ